MTGCRRLCVVMFATTCSLLCASAVQASTVSPLPAADYTMQSVCAAPAPGHASCLAQLLVPSTTAARAHTHPLGITTDHAITGAGASEGAYGLRPQDLRSAYFPGEQPDAPVSETQTVALLDAYNDLDAEADLKIYDEEMGLPECTTGDGCFEQVNQNGEASNLPFPQSKQSREAREAICESATAEPTVREAACKEVEEANEWAAEVSADIEVAHAVCQNCHILLVEADEAEDPSLETAENTAVRLGATEVSNSWGGEEPPSDSEAFNHPGTVITAAAGDNGYLNWDTSSEEEKEGVKVGSVNYPASSPHVVAVGGTRLTLSAPGETWGSESVWIGNGNGTGGGCSVAFPAQEWQRDISDWSSVGCEGRRAVSDVSADASPSTGVAVYDSVPYVRPGKGLKTARVLGWTPIGGTSVASPIIASMFALAGGSHGVEYPAKTLYSHLGSASLHDVTEGGSGKCHDNYSPGCTGSMNPLSLTDCGEGIWICNATVGYDGPSGVGTPNGIEAFRPTRQRTGGGPETPVTEECGGPIFAGTGKVCGTLNPHSNGRAGYHFAYNKGTSCTGGKETALKPQEQGEHIQVAGELFGLEAETQYAYCLIATDVSGETIGSTVTFTTEPAPPKEAQTLPATDITTDSATLEGSLGVQPIKTSWYFDYHVAGTGCDGNGAKTTPGEEDTTLGEPDEASAPVAGLAPGTKYTACLAAKNRSGATTGTQVWFTTEPISPTIESVSAKSTDTEVTIEAKTNPNAQTATCMVRYGTTEAYGSTVPCNEGLGNNGEHVLASAHIARLNASTTYYYQVIVENQIGKSSPSEGEGTVATEPNKPAVIGESGSALSTTTAVVAGTIKPELASTQYHFEYGETEVLGRSTAGGEVGASAGKVLVGPEIISDLKPGTTYYYRLRAVNITGEAVGEAKTFTMPSIGQMLAIPTPAAVLIPRVPSTVIESWGNVSFASPGITVQSDGTALVTLDCLGIGSCNGELALTTKKTVKPKRKNNKKTITVTIGTVSFSISGDEAKAAMIRLDSTGRKLLSKDHQRLAASLTILELAPSPKNTQTKAVQLVQDKAHGKTKK